MIIESLISQGSVATMTRFGGNLICTVYWCLYWLSAKGELLFWLDYLRSLIHWTICCNFCIMCILLYF